MLAEFKLKPEECLAATNNAGSNVRKAISDLNILWNGCICHAIDNAMANAIGKNERLSPSEKKFETL